MFIQVIKHFFENSKNKNLQKCSFIGKFINTCHFEASHPVECKEKTNIICREQVVERLSSE